MLRLSEDYSKFVSNVYIGRMFNYLDPTLLDPSNQGLNVGFTNTTTPEGFVYFQVRRSLPSVLRMLTSFLVALAEHECDNRVYRRPRRIDEFSDQAQARHGGQSEDEEASAHGRFQRF